MKALVYTGGKKLIYQDYSDPIKKMVKKLLKLIQWEFVVLICMHF